jgi:hypothetical protein
MHIIFRYANCEYRGHPDRMVVGFTPTQSVSITTNVVSSSPRTEFVCDLWQVSGFLRFTSINKTDLHDITEILLKVALTIMTLTPNSEYSTLVCLTCE